MNFTITWIMDRLGYVPKASIDFQEWPFPVAKKVVTKKVSTKTDKIPKATTRKSTKKCRGENGFSLTPPPTPSIFTPTPAPAP